MTLKGASFIVLKPRSASQSLAGVVTYSKRFKRMMPRASPCASEGEELGCGAALVLAQHCQPPIHCAAAVLELGGPGGGGGGWACRLGFGVLVCSRRRLIADRHSLPFPSLSLSEGPPSRCFGPPGLFLHRWRVASTKTFRIHTALPFTSTRPHSCAWRSASIARVNIARPSPLPGGGGGRAGWRQSGGQNGGTSTKSRGPLPLRCGQRDATPNDPLDWNTGFRTDSLNLVETGPGWGPPVEETHGHAQPCARWDTEAQPDAPFRFQGVPSASSAPA